MATACQVTIASKGLINVGISCYLNGKRLGTLNKKVPLVAQTSVFANSIILTELTANKTQTEMCKYDFTAIPGGALAFVWTGKRGSAGIKQISQ